MTWFMIAGTLDLDINFHLDVCRILESSPGYTMHFVCRKFKRLNSACDEFTSQKLCSKFERKIQTYAAGKGHSY